METKPQIYVIEGNVGEDICNALSTAGYEITVVPRGQELSTPAASAVIIAAVPTILSAVVDDVDGALLSNDNTNAIFVLPKNPTAPQWGDKFNDRAAFINEGCSAAEFLSFLAACTHLWYQSSS